jgi:hypothetical protein
MLYLHPHPYNYLSRIIHRGALGRFVTLRPHRYILHHAACCCILITQYIIGPV